MDIWEMLSFWGVPAAVTAFSFWLVKRHFQKQSDKKEAEEAAKEAARKKLEDEKEQRLIEREKHREKLLLLLIQSTRQVTVLSEATARAVQRIPDAKCNGDMTRALEYVANAQNKQKDFLMELGIHSIYE